MFLSKKWIFSIIAITGISFLILLIIQFGWIRKSIEINRRHFDDKMLIASNDIRTAFLSDKPLQKEYLSDGYERGFLFNGNPKTERLESTIRLKLDSVLKSEEIPVTSRISGKLDSFCYLMNYIPDNLRNVNLDHSTYKICLCSNNYPGRLDIGFNLIPNNLMMGDSSALILPSVILILLLIVLFTYIIYTIERQKNLADLKNDFINNLTHEFNTPLFSIGLTSTLLLKSETVNHSDKLKGYVELITAEKNRLQTQVDKILRLTAVEATAHLLEKEKVDMHALIEQNINGFSPVIAEKGGSFSFYPKAVNHFVSGDPIHLFNALSNLIDNAIKYSTKIPEIAITTGNREHELIIHIRDNGVGMNKTDVHRIFDKFYRVKQGDRHDVKGFGIGLSYVKKIIELHNGTIGVETKPGEGSDFIIHLPYAT